MAERPVALVTGATGGIGRVVVERLLREGYDVMATALHQERLDALDTQLRCPHHLFRHAAAMEDVESIRALVEVTVKATPWKCIDLLVTCHGAAPAIGPSESLDARDWQRVHDTDVWGTFNVCQQAGRMMIRQKRGCMVLLSSIHARQSYPERAAYAAAKAGVAGLARALAVEWGKYHIRVNCVAPAEVEGERTQAIAQQQDLRGQAIFTDTMELLKRRSPARRLVQPEDVAETVLWLAKMPAITGQTVVLDHGVMASAWYRPFLEEG